MVYDSTDGIGKIAMKSWHLICSAVLILAIGLVVTIMIQRGANRPTNQRTKVLMSPVFTADQLYHSMVGPHFTTKLPSLDESDFVWLTGYEAQAMAVDGKTEISQEFICHSDLYMDFRYHNNLFQTSGFIDARLFIISQGQHTIKLPPGFGIPMLSKEPLTWMTQLLNLNPQSQDQKLRHKLTIHYTTDDPENPLKALFQRTISGAAVIDGSEGYPNVAQPDPEKHGPGCLTREAAAALGRYSDSVGRRFTNHWVVPPGKEVNPTLVTQLLNLPYDTTVHYIAIHLHPFAESLELVDLTENKTLFKSHVRNTPDRIGIEHVEYFSSVEGLPMYTDHEYQLTSVYNNTTSENQDSMASMCLYLHDKQYRKPSPEKVLKLKRDMAAGGEFRRKPANH